MKKIILTTALALASTSLFGALSASMERTREFKTLLSSPQLQKMLGPYRQINSMRRSGISFPMERGDGVFVITTTRGNNNLESCTITASINYKPSDKMGPRDFSLNFSKPVCFN